MNSKAVISTFFIWLALALILAAIGVVAVNWSKWHGLAKRGVETKGRVVGKEPENHKFIRYSYEVNQQTYSGLGSAGRGNPTFEQLNIGDKVTVFYDPADPNESILGNPQEQANSVTVGVLFLAIGGSLVATVNLYRKGWLPTSRPRRI